MTDLQAVENSPGIAPEPGSFLNRGRRAMSCLRSYCHAPAAGKKPKGLRVSDRAWRRHSALLMTLYEQDGHDR